MNTARLMPAHQSAFRRNFVDLVALGTVADASFGKQVAVLVGIAILMTVGVYGLVAGIVKLDDAGMFLNRSMGDSAFARFKRALGRAILFLAPWLMKLLTVVGTAAMFLVGGGILTHGVPVLHHAIEDFSRSAGEHFAGLTAMLADGVIGIVAGALVLGVVTVAGKFFRKSAA